MLKPLSTYIATGLSLTLGTTLHAGHFPTTAPDFCTAILEHGVERVSQDDATMREKAVQFSTRATTYFAARDEAWRIFNFVINKTGVPINGWWIHSILGDALQGVGQDENGRFVFSTNVVIRARKET